MSKGTTRFFAVFVRVCFADLCRGPGAIYGAGQDGAHDSLTVHCLRDGNNSFELLGTCRLLATCKEAGVQRAVVTWICFYGLFLFVAASTKAGRESSRGRRVRHPEGVGGFVGGRDGESRLPPYVAAFGVAPMVVGIKTPRLSVWLPKFHNVSPYTLKLNLRTVRPVWCIVGRRGIHCLYYMCLPGISLR